MRSIFLFTFFFFFTYYFSYSQKSFSIGIMGGSNLTVTSVSGHRSASSEVTYLPNIGYSLGIITKKDIGDQFQLSANLFLERRRDLDVTEVQLINEFQMPQGNFPNRRIVNVYLKPEINFAYRFRNGLAIGSGVNFYILADSKTKMKKFFADNKYENYHYRSFNFDFPIFLSYTYKKFTARVIYNKGIISRIKDSTSYIKEKENTLSWQIGYYFY